MLEQKTQWANRADLYVGLLKEAVRKDTKTDCSPLVLWDYDAERLAMILSLTVRDLFQLQGSNPYTANFGEEGNISNICQFAWYYKVGLFRQIGRASCTVIITKFPTYCCIKNHPFLMLNLI